jgi:hypothetical protein
MPAEVVREDSDSVVIEITIPKHSCFVECEEEIQKHLNHAGRLATGSCLADFDTDGSPIILGNRKLTAKSEKVSKNYETPYGTVPVPRYCYQDSSGGAGHIPLDKNARIIGNSTPRFANIVSFKYSGSNAGGVQRDLKISLQRDVSRCYIQDVSHLVAEGISAKDDTWDLTESEPAPMDVATVGIGLDGACLFFSGEGYRQAMAGTIAYYDAAGERLHTIYIGAAPEYGKATFLTRMDEEITRVKEKYPDARYVGISDGAKDFAPWLKKYTTTQVLDFWHLTEYLSDAAQAMFRKVSERETWLNATCHRLKHEHGASKAILKELKAARRKPKLSKKAQEMLDKAISYLENALSRTNYASYRKSHIPIGSGVTEAACKTLVKQRMCGSGMKWKSSGADAVLSLRSLALTNGAWESFWAKIRKFGL